jgi:membrane-bound acyltransferase YfiQ involved in biofilm formation
MTKKNAWLTIFFVFLILLVVRVVLISLQGQSAAFLLKYLGDVSLGFFIGMAIMQLEKYTSKPSEKSGD